MRRFVRQTVLGLFGAAVVAAAPPQRIVSTAPVVTELLYGIGVFDRVVAVSEFCTYPAAAKALPKVRRGLNIDRLEKACRRWQRLRAHVRF